MKFQTKSLQNDLFGPVNSTDTGRWNFTTQFYLLPCDYDGVKDYPYIIKRQFVVGSKISKYLRKPFVWPDKVFFGDLPENAWGEAIMNGKKSIKYSYSLKHDYRLQKITPGHEMAHLIIGKLDNLYRMYSNYVILDDGKVNFITIPTGKILAEGGIEVLLTKVKEPRGGYESWFKLMRKIDNLAPVEDLHYEAQIYGSDDVWHKLYDSGVMKLIDNYILEELRDNGFKEPIIVDREDLSIKYK